MEVVNVASEIGRMLRMPAKRMEPLTDVEIEDRREMLRQQKEKAEQIAKQYK